jgi:hypothetical protein
VFPGFLLAFGRSVTEAGLEYFLASGSPDGQFPRASAKPAIRPRTRRLAFARASPHQRSGCDETDRRATLTAPSGHFSNTYIRTRLLLRMRIEVRAQRSNDRILPIGDTTGQPVLVCAVEPPLIVICPCVVRRVVAP